MDGSDFVPNSVNTPNPTYINRAGQVVKESDIITINVECRGQSFPVKVLSLPKKCSKCQDRRHRGLITKSQFGSDYPNLCVCIAKVLAFEQHEKVEI